MVRASKRKAELSSPPPSEDAHPEEPQEESEEEQVSGEEVDPVRFPAAASSFGLQRTNETSEPPGSLPTHRRCSVALHMDDARSSTPGFSSISQHTPRSV
jgi:hypothetical protein